MTNVSVIDEFVVTGESTTRSEIRDVSLTICGTCSGVYLSSRNLCPVCELEKKVEVVDGLNAVLQERLDDIAPQLD